MQPFSLTNGKDTMFIKRWICILTISTGYLFFIVDGFTIIKAAQPFFAPPKIITLHINPNQNDFTEEN